MKSAYNPMDNAIGVARPKSPDASPAPPPESISVHVLPELLSHAPDVEHTWDPSQSHINIESLKDGAVPPLSSLQLAHTQLHAIPHLTDNVSFALFGIEAAGSRVTPINVDNSPLLPEPPVLEQVPGIGADSDPVSACVARVLEIVPDVEPDHLTKLVTSAASTHGRSEVLQHVLHILFEDPKYPKSDPEGKGKGKRKRADDEDIDKQSGGSKRPKVDSGYGDLSRVFTGGPDYPDLALVWNSFRRCMNMFRSEAGTSTRRLPFPPEGVSERIS